jgi:formamidopyrimidine-DNA glycosylase
MPELPDLQVFSRNLTRILKGKKLKKLEIPYTKRLKNSQEEFRNTFEGKKLTRVFREGKELRFEFEKGSVLGLHLMLKGNLYLFENKHDKKYPIVELYFADSSGLVVTDFQGQAHPILNPEIKETPDALSEEVNYEFLKTLLGKSKSPVKTVLMDQKKIRGIGNAYADEILWDAGISPFSVSNKIPGASVRKLAKSVKKVLAWAEKEILKAEPNLITGEVRSFLKIHNSKKTKSPTGGKIIADKTKRVTYYTKEQKVFK